MELRDAPTDGDGAAGSELEYELTLDNPSRRALSSAVVVLNGIGTAPGAEPHTAVLWNGPPSSKERVRMRGIVALPRGITTTSVSQALRERRASIHVRVSAQNGAVAACGTLRE